MYIDRVPNRNSRPTILLREGWREHGKVHKRTVANLSRWPEDKIDSLDRVLKGERLVNPKEAFLIERSLPHGHVEAILGTIRAIGLDKLISAKRCRQRDLTLAMIAERLICPSSKLATTRLWHTSTLAQELAVEDATEDDLYQALDWLLERQPRIEKRLAAKHLTDGSLVLYDVTSAHYEGHTCPLVRYGHARGGKKGCPIVVFGLLTDKEGNPVSVDVYAGNTADPTTVPDQVEKLRDRFSLARVVLVGDRGMLTEPKISSFKEHPGLGWISALRSGAIRKLVDQGALQMSLFDQQSLAEIRSPLFPGERLVACFNPLLANERRRKREALLAATQKELDKIVRDVKRRTRTPLDKAAIGKKVGKVLNRHKMGKHFSLKIDDGLLSYERKDRAIDRESSLDGIYVIRTSESEERMSPEDAVRNYKNLAHVERAFRSIKGLDILVRPIFHRTENHVRAHIFLCMLAYYVEHHMRALLRPLLFDDEQLPDLRAVRDPVKPAGLSASAKRKKATHRTTDDLPVQSFRTLLDQLSTRCRNSCRVKGQTDDLTFSQNTVPTALQKRAFSLLGLSCSQ
jgi:transposase